MSSNDDKKLETSEIEQNSLKETTNEEYLFEEKATDRIHTSVDHGVSFLYAGFWMRFWAYLLDLVVIGSIDRLLINPLFRMLKIELYEISMFAPISIATAITFYGYFVLMTKFFNQTLGKMVFGLKVVSLDGKRLTWSTILFREWIGRFISTTVFISYVIVAFLPKKQGLHDLFVDTTVVHEK